MEETAQPLTLTVEQAAKILGIGRSTAYELVHTGDIPSLRLGRRLVVPAARLADSLGVSVSVVQGEMNLLAPIPRRREDHRRAVAAEQQLF